MTSGPVRKPGKGGGYRPLHGKDYDFSVSLRELDIYKTSRTRDRLTCVAIGCAIGSMGLAAIYGMVVGSFGGLKDVWVAAGPMVGAVVGYYFHRGRKDSE